jgi:glucose/arabinose dehydrogenase
MTTQAPPYTPPMRRIAVVLIAIVIFLAAAWLLLPERYAVNGPMLHLLYGRGGKTLSEQSALAMLHAPPGFTLTRFASNVPNVRLLRVTPEGDLLVSQPRAGRVLLIERDRDGDGRADGVRVLLDGLDRPHGIDWYDGWLYVAESGTVRRVLFDPATRAISGTLETLVAGLPAGGYHWTRTLRIGPDGAIYLSVGSNCNVCAEPDHRRAALLRYRLDGTGEELYASGLRNSVGFDWQPQTGDLYATDNGRDLLGDDAPPCELDRIVRGGFYGWPFAFGDRQTDPDMGAGHEADVARSLPPAHAFRAHNAPLGITFLRSPQVSAAYRGAALVALHGSWNRRHKDGYKVVSLHWRADGSIEERDFLTGFLDGETAIGRPVDIAEDAAGAIYVSDDYGGSVFRLQAGGATASGDTPQTPPPPVRAEAPRGSVSHGAALYARFKCAGCHEGIAASHPLEHLEQRHTAESIADYLRAPTPPMPAFPLTDSDRRDLAAFLLQPSR